MSAQLYLATVAVLIAISRRGRSGSAAPASPPRLPVWVKGRLDHGLLRPTIRVRSTSTSGHAGDLVRHGSWVPCMDDARVARGICHLSEAFGCSHVFGL